MGAGNDGIEIKIPHILKQPEGYTPFDGTPTHLERVVVQHAYGADGKDRLNPTLANEQRVKAGAQLEERGILPKHVIVDGDKPITGHRK